MNHAFESRPTFYNGVQFRSRLEAQWACFFDQAKWKWDYEPMDLLGWGQPSVWSFHAVTPSALTPMCF